MKISNEIFEAADAAFDSSMETMARIARYDFSPQILAVLYEVMPLIRAEALEEAANVADGYHQRALAWARTVHGLENHIDETDSSRIAADIRALKGGKG